MDADSVSQWLGQLQGGHQSALQKLHTRYWPVVVRLARQMLRGHAIADADENDIAQLVFISLFDGAQRAKFPDLGNREKLLALLTVITARRAMHQMHREARQKRGSRRTVHVSALGGDDEMPFETADSTDAASPLETLILNETYQRLLRVLPDELRPYGALFLDGISPGTIALKLGCVQRTVERKIQRIRKLWQTWIECEEDDS